MQYKYSTTCTMIKWHTIYYNKSSLSSTPLTQYDTSHPYCRQTNQRGKMLKILISLMVTRIGFWSLAYATYTYDKTSSRGLWFPDHLQCLLSFRKDKCSLPHKYCRKTIRMSDSQSLLFSLLSTNCSSHHCYHSFPGINVTHLTNNILLREITPWSLW